MSNLRTKCGFCESRDLFTFLDLGLIPLTDAFLPAEKFEKCKETEIFLPLSVMSCRSCGLAQLSCIVPPNILYNERYLYDSAVTQTGKRHWHNFAQDAWTKFNCSKGDLVIDIGSNSGALLEQFKSLGATELGVDPAKVPTSLAIKKGLNTIVSTFTSDVSKAICNEYGKAKLVTATNVFAHINHASLFLESVNEVLCDRGVLIIEAPHFLELVAKVEYDTIYHEHIYYLSVRPMKSLLKANGFTLFDVKPQSIHGGSLRYFVCREGDYPVEKSVQETINKELEFGLYDERILMGFASKVKRNKALLHEMLIGIKMAGKSIAAVGASAKGSTLINYCSFGTELIDFISEKSELKIGTFSPGKHIPVVSDAELMARKPDYCLLLAWNFADEIMANLSEYKKNGGKFILPLPEPVII